MPKTIFEATSRARLIERIGRLRPDSPRGWGTMTAARMMCHLEDSLRCATALTPAKQRKTLMANRVVRWLIIYLMPWPKGRARTVKEMLATTPGEFEADRRRLVQLLETAAAQTAGGTWAPHPAFGNLAGRDYGVLIHRHFDYHLRQFGV